jgi:hypothetical protein
MSRSSKTATVEPPAEETPAAITVTCTTCGAQVAAVDIADHVCDDAAEDTGQQPLDETVLHQGPHAVPTTAPAGVWASWLIDELEELAAGGETGETVATATHAIIVFSDGQAPFVAGVSDSAESGLEQAGALVENGLHSGELRVFPINELQAAAGRAVPTTAEEPEPEYDPDAVAAEAAAELGIADVADAVLDEATAQIAAVSRRSPTASKRRASSSTTTSPTGGRSRRRTRRSSTAASTTTRGSSSRRATASGSRRSRSRSAAASSSYGSPSTTSSSGRA